MDAIIKSLSLSRNDTNNKLTIAYLCTPTDCHLIPASARNAQLENFRRETLWMTLLRFLSLHKFLVKNVEKQVRVTKGEDLCLVDAIVVDQVTFCVLWKNSFHKKTANKLNFFLFFFVFRFSFVVVVWD